MKQIDPKNEFNRRRARLSAFAGILCLGLIVAAPAHAAFEQIGTFAGKPGVLQLRNAGLWPEEVQLGGVGGMAVNYTGAGGVPAGTIYADTAPALGSPPGETERVARYNPGGGFSEAWTFNGSLGGAPEQRCGPEGVPTEPTCRSRPEAGVPSLDVDVDQNTGYVYVLSSSNTVGSKRVHVYTPDGSQLIAEFGEQGKSSESFSASPGKIHSTLLAGSIAVDGTGNVYIYDQNEFEGQNGRLMRFEPQTSGDYQHYVYSGQSHDITVAGVRETRPMVDAAGHVYIARQERVFELDPSSPGGAVLCEFKFPAGGIQGATINPLDGEVFFFSFIDKKIHRLGPCNEESGKFAEAGQLEVNPKRDEVSAMAFDPVRKPAPNRPAGVLYAGSPGGAGGETEGSSGQTLVESSLGYIFAHPVALPPEILAGVASHVSATTAALGAQINPKGPAARYAFQYETQAQFEANDPSDRFAGAVEAPPGGGPLGEGNKALFASASIIGLESQTTYFFRVVATSHCVEEHPEEVCEARGEAKSFRTFPIEAPGLPDHRAYELVSPPQKEGGQVLPADPRISSCGSESTCKPGFGYRHFPMQSAPNGEAIVYEGTAFSGEGATTENEYLAERNSQSGWGSVNLTPPLLRSKGLGSYAAFDASLSRGLLGQQSPTLDSAAPEGYMGLYTQPAAEPGELNPLIDFEPRDRTPEAFKLTYAGASADLSRIFFAANDALTEETPFAPEAVDGGKEAFNLYEWNAGLLSLVNVMPGNEATEPGAFFGPGSAHSISADGTHAFFEGAAHQVYVRINGEETKEIETEGAPDPAKFLAAATNGSRVLLANGHLHYLVGEEHTVDLTEGKGGFQGVAGESEDLSHVYFVDSEILTSEESGQHAKAEKGKANLYAWVEGEGTRFVATLDASDGTGTTLDGHVNDWGVPSVRTAEASPQGRYLAFVSHGSLAGYDNTGPCGTNHANGFVNAPCAEAFLYDSQAGALRCISCNPSGAAPLGWSTLRQIGELGGAAPSMSQPRYLTEEGRLYFDSQDSLSPFDTNNGVEDVYGFEPEGVGSCKRESGCLSLISAGSEPTDSNFLAMDESGKNVFFTTRDQLSLKDHDDLIDLYDAREDGGIPGETEVARSECQGEACQAPVSAPNDPTPGSSTFNGAGNVKEEAKAKKHPKKHKKKRHAKKHTHKRAAKHNRGGAK